MPFTTWIRDILGIRKDVVDTKRVKLEIERLEVEKRERDLITPATLDDIQRIDPKTRRLIQQVRDSEVEALCEQSTLMDSLLAYHWSRRRRRRLVILAATLLIMIVMLIIWRATR